MGKGVFRTVLAFFCAFSMLASGCEDTHVCSYDCKVITDDYLKVSATCQDKARYYYSCSCGAKGETSFTHGEILEHDYSAKVELGQYLKKPANCQKPATYYHSCTMCGKSGSTTFTTGTVKEHSYTREVKKAEYLKQEPTFETEAVYYKSCACGLAGTDTFLGDKLRVHTEEEKLLYKPTSLTVTLYDAQNSIYGFTYNTTNEPLRPVLQIQQGDAFSDGYEEYEANYEVQKTYDATDKAVDYYIVKVQVALNPNTTYTYKAYDKYADVGSAPAKLQTKNVQATTFSFAHVSDSQTYVTSTDKVGAGTGSYFSQTLSQIVDTNDFILHTGDFVEWSKYETYWKAMIDDNFSYLSKIPVMAISGNHETTYRSGSNETYKHFHYKLPNQASTELGFFYSFVYGNAKFIMLNTNAVYQNQLKQEQYDWLIGELENNDCSWTIVAMHNPMYSRGKYGSDSSRNALALGLRAQLKGIFAQYGVDIVLQAHDHLVTRTYPIDALGNITTEAWETDNGVEYTVNPNGVIYMMNGPAGNQSRSDIFSVETELYKYAYASQSRSWADFEISGNVLKVAIKYYDGEQVKTYTTWGIKKN